MGRLRTLQQVQNLVLRAPTIRRPLKDYSNPFECLSDTQFRKRYRFRKDTNKSAIFDLIKDDFSSHGLQLPHLLQILVVLRFLACGAFQMVVGDTIGISQSSVHRLVKQICKCLASQSKEFIKFPNEQEAKVIRAEFFNIAGFPGVTGAIDCTHVRICNPGGASAEVFRNRKGHFTINVQAVCKPNLEFINVVARWKGSTHDSRIFDNSRLSIVLSEGNAPGHLVGDCGYPLRTFLMTPFLNPTNAEERRYNNCQSKTRNPIERAFGVLKKRFNCLGQELRTKLSTSLSVIVACM